jgi:Putative metallopeptidase family (DUF6782)
VVDQSLLRQAADRGVTICFADLDGADGLWVPEERTVLVSRGLSEAKVAEVIEHELAHAMIDDQHADLDAGKEVLVSRPPSRYRRPQTVALAAVSLFVVVGGAMYGVSMARDGTKADQVAPNPDGTGLTAPQESGDPKPSTTVIKTTLPDGQVVERTIVITARPSAATPSGGPTPSSVATPTATKAGPQQPSRSAVSPPATTSAAPVGPTSDAPVTTAPPSVVTTPAPTTSASETGDTGDQGGVGGGTDTGPVGGGIDTGPVGGGIDTGPVGDGIDTGPIGTEPADATVADVPVPPVPGDTATP